MYLSDSSMFINENRILEKSTSTATCTMYNTLYIQSLVDSMYFTGGCCNLVIVQNRNVESVGCQEQNQIMEVMERQAELIRYLFNSSG